jgi:hypothetical protein
MSHHDQKDFYRQLKRDIKRNGNRSRRNFFKRQLRDNPEEAHWYEYDNGIPVTVYDI